MKKLLLYLSLSIALFAETPLLLQADIALEPLALSYHFDREKDTNENHKYVGLVYRHHSGFELGVATMENSHYRRSNSVYVGFSDSFYDFKDGEIGGWFDVGYRTGYNRETLIYGGIYAEYKDVYIKGALGTNLVGCTVGYIFRFEGIK